MQQQESYYAFSQKKRAQFRAQNPDLPMSEINKMVKEQWQRTHKKAGNKTPNLTTGAISGNKRRVSSTKKENQESVSKKLNFSQPTPQKLKMSEEKVIQQRSQRSGDEQYQYSIKQSESIKQTPTKQIEKSKKIKKSKKSKKPERESYPHFMTFYKQKLHKQHPRWSTSQIMTIIKLLWRKKQSFDKKPIISKVGAFKRVSGRTLFGRIKRTFQNMDNDKINSLWRILPRQSRNYWSQLGANNMQEVQRKAMDQRIPLTPTNKRITIRAPTRQTSQQIVVKLSFMNNIM